MERHVTIVLAIAAAAVLGAVPARPAAGQGDLAARIARAKPLKVEDVCTPVTSVRRGELMWVPNPDGRTYDLLQWYFRGYSGPTTAFLIDLATGEIKKDGIPLRRQIHICGRALGPDGKLYIATPDWKKGMEIYVYDPADNRLSCKGVVAPGLAGETRRMTVGTDGKIYGTGSYAKLKKAGAYQLDTATGKVTDYGAIGPSHAPNGCWGYSIAADDRCVYVASGKVPWYLVAYDRVSRKDRVLVTTENVGGYVSVRQHRYGCSATATKVVGTDGRRIEYWLHEGRAIPKKGPKEPPPWPRPKEAKPWVALPPKPEVFLEAATPGPDGEARIWHRRRGGAAPQQRAGSPQPGKAVPPRPEDLGWKAIRLQVPTYPMPIYRLIELGDGRLLGTAGSYEGNFLYDPTTGRSVHMGKIPLSHYATAVVDGRVYMSGYPGSPLYVYDPRRPWTVGRGTPTRKAVGQSHEQSNPRCLARLSTWAGTHKMYAACVGADGRIYFGGRWIRNGSGGGLAWWDRKTQQAGGFWKTFSNYQIAAMTAARGGRYVVISTLGVRDATLGKPTPRQGKLFVFDTAGGRIVREVEPVADARGAGFVADAGRVSILGWTEDPADAKSSVLYGVDVEAGKVTFRKKVPLPLPVRIGSNQREPFDFRLGPRGKVWTYVGGALVRVDPRDAAIEVIGKIRRGGRIAFSGTDIYLAGTEQLRRIRDVVPRP